MDANTIADDEAALDSKIAYAAMVAADTLLSEFHESEIRLLARQGLMKRLEWTLCELQRKSATISVSGDYDAAHIRDAILHAVGNAGKAGVNVEELIQGALTAVAMLAVNGMSDDSSPEDVRQYGEDLGGLLIERMTAVHKLRGHLPAQLATYGIGPVITAEVDAPVTAAGPADVRGAA